ncbi:MAG: GNAT family N-acetyltransferase [Chloroflexi bacterium]|nr:GNAT family N-acetyltransferase [Chloroflexota bacterium]
MIAIAFHGKLGPDGEVALAEMQRVARWGPLLWWLYWPGWGKSGVAPGFVWVDGGRVVGNVSLRRALGWGGFLVGNVAVHPDWQGRGIAGDLMITALEAISARGGRWVGLEVRADNQIARRLYKRFGFREVGKTWHMLRSVDQPWTENPQIYPGLRQGRSDDGKMLFELVRAIVPMSQRPLLELRKEDYRPSWGHVLNYWVEGRREVWWVIEDNGTFCGAARALHERGRRPDRLEVLVAPGYSGRLEAVLVQQGMTSFHGDAKKMIMTVLPCFTDPLVIALEAARFQKSRVLVQMRLDLV